MKKQTHFIFLFLMFTLFFCNVLQARPAGDQVPKKREIDKRDKLSVTPHSIKIQGALLEYTATTGYMKMKDENGKEKASIFFVAYTKEGEKPGAHRPLTFAFNGGPGSASLWLHLGALGPRKVKMSHEGLSFPPPYAVEDNPYTWLKFTDLVFIDPVNTGYSRPAGGVDKKEFHGVQEDIRWVGDFIQLYVTKNERWLSPKFICGESYGTTRATGLSGYLQERYGMFINGLVLVSAGIHYLNHRFAPGNDMPYVLYLPSYTATAWYHKRLSPKYQENLQATLAEVKEWALTKYLPALAKGSRLSKQEREEIVGKLSSYTGLSRDTIDRNNLRIFIFRFVKDLLASEKSIVGRLDSRIKGVDCDPAAEFFEFDPSMMAIMGPFTSVINHYIRGELGYKNDIPYETISSRVRPWNWGEHRQGYVNMAETLRKSIAANNSLKVLVACGYYDLATPFFAAEHTMSHIGLPGSLLGNISFTYYESGHMMYIHKDSLVKLRDDVEKFFKETKK